MTLASSFGLIGATAALLAAALHIFIFYLEVFAWEGPLARSIFGGSAQEARQHAFYAYNQGFYNLFLALGAAVGALLILFEGIEGFWTPVGLSLAIFTSASMLGAALALGLKSSAHRGAAAKQGLFPLIALACLTGAVLL